ncbi:MAG TPA: hypothetical protein VJN94_03525 [Candidatus Binataceae bacterium]|nr:hypothetical protein [Candidatus Binataceae bacterium]
MPFRILLAAFLLTFATLNRPRKSSAQQQGSDESSSSNSLELPQLSGPQLPPAPPPLAAPEVPSALLGCWEGNPGKFDSIQTDTGLVDIGAPGKIIFCYTHSGIEVPEADVAISAKGRALDLVYHLGLGFSTFKAHGIRTDILAVTQTTIRARMELDIVQTDHWLYLIPSHADQPSQVDEVFTLESDDTALVRAEQVIFLNGLKMWGTWHGVFHRLEEDQQ